MDLVVVVVAGGDATVVAVSECPSCQTENWRTRTECRHCTTGTEETSMPVTPAPSTQEKIDVLTRTFA